MVLPSFRSGNPLVAYPFAFGDARTPFACASSLPFRGDLSSAFLLTPSYPFGVRVIAYGLPLAKESESKGLPSDL